MSKVEQTPSLGFDVENSVRYVLSAKSIRERCQQVFEFVAAGKSEHLSFHEDKLGDVALYVVSEIERNYPQGDIPYHGRWRHFEVGDIDRIAMMRENWQDLNIAEQARRLIELTIISVLLDAGAGMGWHFTEPKSNISIGKSEGLALASWHMYRVGSFSKDPLTPVVEADALEALSLETLLEGFQVTDRNPLVGVEGRLTLLKNLGRALRTNPVIFGEEARLGSIFDCIVSSATDDKDIDAEAILQTILYGLGPIWPGRIELHDINLGDVWRHPAAHAEDDTNHLVPFHKLSQWLTYSLLEPLEMAGYTIVNLDALTGLPEYRNGGLFTDLGVLQFRDPDPKDGFHASDQSIIEWRAATVCLLDQVAEKVRDMLGADQASLPLARILQGGTWSAGRRLAAERRQDGGPPIKITSDGTVF